MPPKKAVAADETGANGAGAGAGANSLLIKDKVPSEGDHRFFLAMIANLVTKPDVNWDGVAETMGLKDVKCTKERWRQITKKYELELQDGAGPTATPAKGRGRKPAAIKTDGENPDDAGEGALATPKPRATRGKKTPAKSADIAISDDEQAPGEDAPANPTEPTTATPSKTSRRRKPASSTKKRASPGDENEDGVEDGTPPKKKQAARKPRGPNKKTLEAQAAAAAAAAATVTETDPEVADTTKVTSTTDGDNTNVDTEMKEADEDFKKEDPESSLSPAPPSTAEGGEN